jgi:hypothetical protein
MGGDKRNESHNGSNESCREHHFFVCKDLL